jgi:hypothetical protein
VRTDPDGQGDTVLVEAMDPQLMVEITGQAGALKAISDEASAKLEAAISAIGQTTRTE